MVQNLIFQNFCLCVCVSYLLPWFETKENKRFYTTSKKSPEIRKYTYYTSELIRKCSSRLYFLRQLKRSGVAPSELVQFFVTCIRPVLEYASPVFHRSLPNYISEDLDRIQRRAFRIIYPALSYSVALETVGLPKLQERREKISIDLSIWSVMRAAWGEKRNTSVGTWEIVKRHYSGKLEIAL